MTFHPGSTRGLATLLLSFAAGVHATSATATIASTAVIYNAGASIRSGAIAVSASAKSVSFTHVKGSLTSSAGTLCGSALGCILLNNRAGNSLNNPDGAGAATSFSTNLGVNGISGIAGPGAGYLVGVFVPSGGPTGAPPASLDFRSSGMGTSFAELSPLLDQAFFIGDGLTGNGSGSTQTFNVPAGASALYLGISDACGYHGDPGCYADNLGSFNVTYIFSDLPANATAGFALLMLVCAGLASLVFLLGKSSYRRARAAVLDSSRQQRF